MYLIQVVFILPFLKEMYVRTTELPTAFFFFLIDVSLLKLMCLSVYSVTVCLVA